MPSFIGTGIVVILLGICLFFAGRAAVREIRNELAGNGCGNCSGGCSGSCASCSGSCAKQGKRKNTGNAKLAINGEIVNPIPPEGKA